MCCAWLCAEDFSVILPCAATCRAKHYPLMVSGGVTGSSFAQGWVAHQMCFEAVIACWEEGSMATTSPSFPLPWLGLTAANECGSCHFFHCVQCACYTQPLAPLLRTFALTPLFCCCRWSTSRAEQKQQELIGMTAATDIDTSFFISSGYVDTTTPTHAQIV